MQSPYKLIKLYKEVNLFPKSVKVI